MSKKVLITGCVGQLGSTLCDMLVARDYEVHGLKRRSSRNTTENLAGVLNKENFTLLEGSIDDGWLVAEIVKSGGYDWIINCAAMAHVKHSFDTPGANINVNSVGVLNFLEAIRHLSPNTKFVTLGSSEQFGANYTRMRRDILTGNHNLPADLVKVQDLSVPFDGRSPYSISKITSHLFVKLYREAYKLWCAQPICFNFEGPRRSDDYVTMKIVKYVGRIYRGELGEDEKLELGNIKACRAWNLCESTAEGIILTIEQEKPKDYVFSSDEVHSVEEFLSEAFSYIGKNWQDYVVISEKYYRPTDVEYLLGNYSEAREELNWRPKVSFKELVRIMMDEEIGNIIATNNKTTAHSMTIQEIEESCLRQQFAFTVSEDNQDVVNRIRKYQTC